MWKSLSFSLLIGILIYAFRKEALTMVMIMLYYAELQGIIRCMFEKFLFLLMHSLFDVTIKESGRRAFFHRGSVTWFYNINSVF